MLPVFAVIITQLIPYSSIWQTATDGDLAETSVCLSTPSSCLYAVCSNMQITCLTATHVHMHKMVHAGHRLYQPQHKDLLVI